MRAISVILLFVTMSQYARVFFPCRRSPTDQHVIAVCGVGVLISVMLASAIEAWNKWPLLVLQALLAIALVAWEAQARRRAIPSEE